MRKLIKQLAQKVIEPKNVGDIPADCYMVYILTCNRRCIVCGHGKKNRARVIFDCPQTATSSHIKSMLVRIYMRHGGGAAFARFVVPCESKHAAARLENQFHKTIGGDSSKIPHSIYKTLTTELDPIPKMIVDMALCSAFSGLRDLKKWRQHKLMNDESWAAIEAKLGQW